MCFLMHKNHSFEHSTERNQGQTADHIDLCLQQMRLIPLLKVLKRRARVIQ